MVFVFDLALVFVFALSSTRELSGRNDGWVEKDNRSEPQVSNPSIFLATTEHALAIDKAFTKRSCDIVGLTHFCFKSHCPELQIVF